MRLIDADALIDDIKNNLWDWETVDGITATTVLKQTISDIGNQPTIEERKTGKWVGIKEYCDHLNEEAEREGKGNRYMPSGMNIHVYCNQCWQPNDRRTTYCPDCGARMAQEGEDNG